LLWNFRFKTASACCAENLFKALKISEEFVRQDAADGQARENLAITFFRLGAIASNLKNNEQAIAYLEKAIAILAELEKAEPKNRNYKMYLGRIYTRYGFIKSNQNDWRNALADYKKAAGIFQEVTQIEAQNKTAWRYLAGQYTYIAEIHANQTRRATGENQQTHRSEAIENYRQALDIYLQLQAQNSLAEYDRKFIEQTRTAMETLVEN